MNIQGRRILIINILLFAILFGLVSLNKEVFRPYFSHIPLARSLTGCFPNFIAAYTIGLASVIAVLIKNPRHGRLIVYIVTVLVFTVLTIEEIKPMWGASEYYDLFDIMASGAGSLLAISTFEIITSSRKPKPK